MSCLVSFTVYPKNTLCGSQHSFFEFRMSKAQISVLRQAFPSKTHCVRMKVLTPVLPEVHVFLDTTLSLDDQFQVSLQLIHCASTQELPSQGLTSLCSGYCGFILSNLFLFF